MDHLVCDCLDCWVESYCPINSRWLITLNGEVYEATVTLNKYLFTYYITGFKDFGIDKIVPKFTLIFTAETTVNEVIYTPEKII